MSWDFIRITTPRAGKPHKCSECGRPIAKGDKHVYVKGRQEGCFVDYRMCLYCHELSQAWCDEWDDGEGWPMGELVKSIRENSGCANVDDWLTAHRMRRSIAADNYVARLTKADAIARKVVALIRSELAA